jgi:hypothetical protein
MKSQHRDPALVSICASLDRLKNRPGLAVCERLCLSPDVAGSTIKEFPTLEYAVLMQWVRGLSWFDNLCQRSFRPSQSESLKLAANLARIIAGLEADGIAHCDLSAANVLFDPNSQQVELIDLEDLFTPGSIPPQAIPCGTPGYQHLTSPEGQWHARGDRFAGAILLCEMLGWYESAVRAACYGESFFLPAELQQPSCPRLEVLTAAISRHHPAFGSLLRRAWFSRSLDECPSLAQWSQVFTAAQSPSSATWVPISIAPPNIGVRAQPQPFWVPLAVPERSHPSEPPVKWLNGLSRQTTRQPVRPSAKPLHLRGKRGEQ